MKADFSRRVDRIGRQISPLIRGSQIRQTHNQMCPITGVETCEITTHLQRVTTPLKGTLVSKSSQLPSSSLFCCVSSIEGEQPPRLHETQNRLFLLLLLLDDDDDDVDDEAENINLGERNRRCPLSSTTDGKGAEHVSHTGRWVVRCHPP